jgi:sugar phosphate isomerase/epimerase
MKNWMDRRGFLTSAAAIAAGMGLANRSTWAAMAAKGAPNAEKLGWQLGCQAYSFNRFTFEEAVDKIASLGLHCVEMYPGQKLSDKAPDQKTDASMSPLIRKLVKQRLKDRGVKLLNFGVCPLPKDEDACRETFDFAQDMGIKTLVSEPDFEALDVIEKLCDEYDINVAIHNHPEPSKYWNYETVLKHCKGRSNRIGACADSGHWMRSGINPLEAIKALEGRIISFHLKDLNKYGRQGAHDVPWGTGEANVKALLTEIHRQKIKAVFSIEYEHNWLESLPEIAQSVAYFDSVAADLSGKQ